MILGEPELAWEHRITAAARGYGWTIFRQSPAGRSNDQHQPSMILVRRDRVLLVFLRLSVRPGHRPPIEDLAAMTGCPVVLWQPRDWSEAVRALRDAGGLAPIRPRASCGRAGATVGAPATGQPGRG